jgi:hypothetical protein
MSLASAVLALMVSLALMSAEALFLLEDTRLAENSVAEAQAGGLAERGIGDLLGRDSLSSAARPLGGGLFLVDVTGTVPDAGRWRGARARTGLLVRVVPPAFPEAALISGGSVALSPGAVIEGAVDSGASGPGLTGELDLDRVAARAGVVQSGGPYSPQPNVVVHIQGDAEIDGGAGSGVILVDGNLAVRGSFTFSGVILVRGALVVSGSGTSKSHLTGSVVTFIGASGDSGVWITHSKQIVDNVLAQFGRPEKLRSRSWIKLF